MSSSVRSDKSKKKRVPWYYGGTPVKGTGKDGAQRSAEPVNLMDLKGKLFMYGVPDQAERFLMGVKLLGEYVGYEFGMEFNTLVVDREEPDFKEPDPPKDPAKATRTDWKKFEMLFRENREEKKEYEKKKGRVFVLIIAFATRQWR